MGGEDGLGVICEVNSGGNWHLVINTYEYSIEWWI